MNRDFLKKTGVPEEVIDIVMAAYGKDLQAEKDRAREAAEELETYRAKVADLEKAAGDSEAVRKELDGLKAQIAEEKRAAEEKAADEQLTATIKAAFPADRKFVNKYTEEAYISRIKAEMNKPENKGKGVSDIFNALTKDEADIFQNPNRLSDMSGFGGATGDDVDDAKIRRVMGLPTKE